jgi:hypothetical protein
VIAMGKRQVLEGKGKFVNRRTTTANKEYDRFFIYVPVEVARDSAFPFKTNEIVAVKIDAEKRRLLVEKAKR